jgi:hypothetical protein
MEPVNSSDVLVSLYYEDYVAPDAIRQQYSVTAVRTTYLTETLSILNCDVINTRNYGFSGSHVADCEYS